MKEILLAEDDEDVRPLLCAMLARAGYRTEAYCMAALPSMRR